MEEVNEQEVYEYYTQSLLPALIRSLPILLSRVTRDITSFLVYYTTQFIQFLFPIWFRRWTIDTTDTIARAADKSSEFLSHTFSDIKNITIGINSTFIDNLLEKMDLNGDGKISASEWGSNAEEMKREIEVLMQQYYHAVTDKIHLAQQTNNTSSWYSTLRSLIGKIIAVDWSMGAYLWHTCSGLIIVLIITSIVPGRLHGWTGRLLRWPILGMTYMLITVEIIMYALVRFAIRALEGIFANTKHRAMRNEMSESKTYEEWYDIATKLDNSQGRIQWRNNVNDDTAYRYSWPFILELLSDLKKSREHNDIMMALAVLQQCTRKNVGGIMSDDLFSFTNTGEPKVVVTEFINEVEKTIEWVTEEVRERSRPPPNVRKLCAENSAECIKEKDDVDEQFKSAVDQEQNKIFDNMLSWATLGILGKSGDEHDTNIEEDEKKKKEEAKEEDGNEPPKEVVSNLVSNSTNEEYARNLVLREKIKTFLKRARAAYGRTALCLSGGAMMGNYHFGAVKALLETDLLPHIISGTSAGSVIGAMLCTRTEEELMRDLKPEVLAPRMSIFASSWGQRWARWYKYGTMFDQADWYRRVRWFTCGDTTFEEAFRKTGRIFCVTLSATSKKAPPVLINYITAPNVVIASAVLASAAVPGKSNLLLLFLGLHDVQELTL